MDGSLPLIFAQPPVMSTAGPMIIDSFAGGGGASTGIEMALGRSPDVAINHDAAALAMHEANHPGTRHLNTNIWQVDPSEVCRGRRVGLAWFSPDCKHHSKAKGGKPVKKSIRDLAWVVVLWAKRARPDVILLENVEEFRDWGPLTAKNRPCPERRGQTFNAWCAELRRLGYKVEHRELRACDYGAPTIRKRLFLVARCDGKPIVWPEPTHGKPGSPEVVTGKRLPWRTAADIIDWSLPCPSIFDTAEEIMAKHGLRAVRPLQDATLRRIARGVMRYVVNSATPFIVGCGGRMGQSAERPVSAPTQTLTAKADSCVVVPAFYEIPSERNDRVTPGYSSEPTGPLGKFRVGAMHAAASATSEIMDVTAGETAPTLAPFVTYAQQGGANRAATDPMHTICASPKDQNAIVAPVLVSYYGEGDGGLDRASTLDGPISTVTTANRHALVAPVLVQTGYGEAPGQAPRSLDIKAPLGTVVAGGGKHALVSAFLAQHNAGPNMEGNAGRPASEPISTLTTAGAQQQVVAAHLMNMHGAARSARDLSEPHPAICAGGQHGAVIAAFLQKYYGQGLGQDVTDPLHTVATRDTFGLVTVQIDGQPYAIADIGMRMLTPREQFRAQGFSDSYIIDHGADGRALTKTEQTRMCGNSVCPPLAAALARANCGHLIAGAVQREAQA